MKKLLLLPLCVLPLAACNDMTGGPQTTYAAQPAYAQPAYVQQAMGGTIVQVRNVQVGAGPNNQTGAAIVGGLAGAIVGNQFGGGSGKTLMTGLGAVGGAMAGSALAQQNGTRISREWTVRLDRGGMMQIIQDGNNLYVGQHVLLVPRGSGYVIQP